ncbi:signal recognition particle, SRP9/SRP14 subunit [Parathielavia appendiculata]|uniref:Signal recognition particle subunit SRP14 n=1 Tax=Parathielavia appendiculata TaxID=2587402 RepID=A0AAN6U1D8_9PEZI|nr:signal recognition particle, SRP9/SRP14 subunit [Parathielavia appendiculata]
MGHLTHDEFFIQLADIFNSRKTKGHGAVYLTQKRLTHNETPSPSPPPTKNEPIAKEEDSLEDLVPPLQPLPILIRATNGKGKEDRSNKEKIKLSTIVQPDELEGFYARYAEACKSGMTALKPRDRTKRKKTKARKRKGGAGAGVGAVTS